MSENPSRPWLATYRLQLRREFDFDRVAEIAPYLAQLGISHVYFSPIVQAAPGSSHGYDVVDPTRISSDLGGAAAYRRATEALERHGIGQMVDIVPNHMSIASADNPWWWDVLEKGSDSRYLRYFDLGWSWTGADAFERILLPVLGGRYGDELAAGALRVAAGEAGFVVVAYDSQRFPVSPATYVVILDDAAKRANDEELRFLADCYRGINNTPPSPGYDRQAVLWGLLTRLRQEQPAVEQALDATLDEINADKPRLNALLDEQHYRLTFWQTADEALSYRRFFDINTLIGVKVEDERVLAERHRLLLDLVRRGRVQGLRIDHIDGLREPRTYLERLHERAPGARLFVEKILAPDEELPAAWPVQGTTGYDFLNVVNGLFVDPAGERALSGIYADFTGETRPFEEILLEKKRLVLRELFGSDLGDLANLLRRIADTHIESRDWRQRDLEAALRETVVAMPVYRTYVQPDSGDVDDTDRRIITDAIDLARSRLPEVEVSVFDFLRDILLLQVSGHLERELVLRLQQLTSPVMAKGAEDTAFYVYNRLISLNEVGGEPGRFGTSLDAFHAFCADAAAGRPHSMVATATHDTKRGEDTRLRIDALSEMPAAWAEAVARWRELNAPHHSGDFPDANAEYLLYQTLAGAWPIEAERAVEFMLKAAREAKVFSSWRQLDEAYESTLSDFTTHILANEQFVEDIAAFVRGLEAGAVASSLSQTLIKLTAPGVPDVYQGTELWDLSLVDPDNRRPVDYALRQQLLERVIKIGPREAMTDVASGLPKLWLLHRALDARRRDPDAFEAGSAYEPLPATGPRAEHVVAFCRGGRVLTVAPRLLHRLGDDWQSTALPLPPGRWQNALAEADATAWAESVEVGALLRDFPVALLVRVLEAS